MSWIGLIYYKDRVDQIGGSEADYYKELCWKVKRFVKQGCQRIEIYENRGAVFPAGIEQIKKGEA